ncbi:hypothetical protein C8R45DRAFT_274100 [Mycena sanguinolenta]|nr:hypothetical protein C8R45DRAFT_274100 [Mycena sanguinolenta]
MAMEADNCTGLASVDCSSTHPLHNCPPRLPIQSRLFQGPRGEVLCSGSDAHEPFFCVVHPFVIHLWVFVWVRMKLSVVGVGLVAIRGGERECECDSTAQHICERERVDINERHIRSTPARAGIGKSSGARPRCERAGCAARRMGGAVAVSVCTSSFPRCACPTASSSSRPLPPASLDPAHRTRIHVFIYAHSHGQYHGSRFHSSQTTTPTAICTSFCSYPTLPTYPTLDSLPTRPFIYLPNSRRPMDDVPEVSVSSLLCSVYIVPLWTRPLGYPLL